MRSKSGDSGILTGACPQPIEVHIAQAARLICCACASNGRIVEEGVLAVLIDEKLSNLDDENLICLCDQHRGVMTSDELRRIKEEQENSQVLKNIDVWLTGNLSEF